MNGIVKILKVEVLGDFRLRLHFTDGTEGKWNFADVVGASGSMIKPLKDPKYFARVFLQLGTLAWLNGFDLDAIAQHDEMSSAGALRQA